LRWPLFETIVDGHSLKTFLEFYDENYISYVEEEGEIGVNKNNTLSIKGNESCLIWNSQC